MIEFVWCENKECQYCKPISESNSEYSTCTFDGELAIDKYGRCESKVEI
jgi:hypothetical protein